MDQASSRTVWRRGCRAKPPHSSGRFLAGGRSTVSQTSPWLRSARLPMILAMLPALLLIAAMIYFTAWAVTYSFTNLELTGPNSINWRWIGFDNYVRLFTRQGFLSSLWVTIVFTF